jgi:hypothetical protein
VARSATDISRRSHAGDEVPIEERVQLQQRKIALLEAINRCSPYKTGAEAALLEAEQELRRLRAMTRFPSRQGTER